MDFLKYLRQEIIERSGALEKDLKKVSKEQKPIDPAMSYCLKCAAAFSFMIEKDQPVFGIEPWYRLKEPPQNKTPAELLLRLKTEEGAPLPPYDFVMPCYQGGFTTALDTILVLAGIYEYLLRIQDMGYDSAALNISARFLEPRNKSNIQFVLDVIDEAHVGEHVIFEIHESSPNTEISPEIMDKFKALGVRFAIDDVALNVGDIFRLSGFRDYIDFVKLDRNFVKDHDSNTGLFSEMLDFILVNAPDTRIVAEGVRDLAQAQRLRKSHQGIDYVQGRDLPEGFVFEA